MIYQVQFLPELKIQGFLETVMKKEKKKIIREGKEDLGIEFAPHFYLEELDKESFPREFWDVRYFEGGFEGKISLNEENSEIMFVSLEDLDNFEIAFDHKVLLIKFFKGKSKCFKKF